MSGHHPKSSLPFQVVIDQLNGPTCTTEFDPSLNRFVLSILNDFEDSKWRQLKFDRFIWDNIGETALSQKERESLASNPMTALIRSAQNLRLTENEDFGMGSELAEIALYAVMKHHYNALSVVPKIFYKQNSQDNAKGSDSVHILLSPDGGFSIWLGEAKFYNSIEDSRFDAIIKSIGEALSGEKLRKENSIITNLSDLSECISDADRIKEIKDLLSFETSIDKLKLVLNVPILLLHQCEKTAIASELSDNYISEIKAHHLERAQSFFERKAQKLKSVSKLSEIKFHLILLPIPNKDNIIKKFIKTAEFYRNEDDE